MIQRVSSSLPSFKSLEFTSGLNVLIAKKESGASDRQTRNRAGKTSLIEIVHFLLGANVEQDSIFRSDTLLNESFSMEFDLGKRRVQVERSGSRKSKIKFTSLSSTNSTQNLPNVEWVKNIGQTMFKLHEISDGERRVPRFRSLFSYFVRRQGGFNNPEKHVTMQQAGDYQVALLFMLGLDWRIASDWQDVREQEKTIKELRKAAGSGTFSSIVGKASELRTELAVSTDRLVGLQSRLAEFRVLPQYAELELEADQLTRSMNDLSNSNVIDVGTIRELERALQNEAAPPLDELQKLYAEAGLALPDVAIERYENVRRFHESVIRNRRDYLTGELDSARQRVAVIGPERLRLDERRAAVMRVLRSHGALSHFSQLQAEAARLEATVESLRQRLQAAEQMEGFQNEMEIERNRLAVRLRRDFSERKERLSEAIIAFEKTSQRLYEFAGSMNIDNTNSGPVFRFPMQGARSKGIKNMQIFCFDMMLMRLCCSRDVGPKFLVHDSHLFDGVDGRQLISALKVGAETANELGFQYIVTLNEDDAFKETMSDFDIGDYVLSTVLTDAMEDGGLFGCRF